MNFNLNSPGLIILNQYKTLSPKDNINHYWYISTDGIDYFQKNTGLFNQLNVDIEDLLNLITQHYKKQFEFAFEKVDLGFFAYWSCLQIQIYFDQRKNISKNCERFFNRLNIEFEFNKDTQTYHFSKFPEITTQYNVFEFVNQHMQKNLESLFLPENVAHCVLTYDDFSIFSSVENKIDFLEKVRFMKQMEQQFPLKYQASLKKI